MSLKKSVKYLIQLRFAPGLSEFLFNYETWARTRYLKVFLSKVDPGKCCKIIDIGGGTGQLEMAVGRKDIYIYDTNEEAIRIASVSFPNAVKGSGSVIEFPDNFFDYAISIHTLEHVPANERIAFISEMIRVSSKGIYLNFPEGEYARKLCVNYLSELEKRGKEKNKWTVEHLENGLPDINDYTVFLSDAGKFSYIIRHIRNYRLENSYWKSVRSSDSFFVRYFLSPFYAVAGYVGRNRKPSVEVLIIGFKEKSLADRFKNI